MHKETSIAVLIGLVLGLALTFGIYQWQKAGKQANEFNLPTAISPTPTLAAAANQEIKISSPEDGTVSTESKITLEGSGPANAFLIIFVNGQENISKIDANKQFKVDVELKTGPNTITAFAAENTGATYQTEILVVYEPQE